MGTLFIFFRVLQHFGLMREEPLSYAIYLNSYYLMTLHSITKEQTRIVNKN